MAKTRIQDVLRETLPHLQDRKQITKDEWRIVCSITVGSDPRSSDNYLALLKNLRVFKMVNGRIIEIDHDRAEEVLSPDFSPLAKIKPECVQKEA